METKKQEVGEANRRDFLKLSALGAVAGVAATGSVAQAGTKTVSDANGEYRETEHVKAFYASARF